MSTPCTLSLVEDPNTVVLRQQRRVNQKVYKAKRKSEMTGNPVSGGS